MVLYHQSSVPFRHHHTCCTIAKVVCAAVECSAVLVFYRNSCKKKLTEGPIGFKFLCSILLALFDPLVFSQHSFGLWTVLVHVVCLLWLALCTEVLKGLYFFKVKACMGDSPIVHNSCVTYTSGIIRWNCSLSFWGYTIDHQFNRHL